MAEVTLTAGADGKSFSHVCKEYGVGQVGEVRSDKNTDPECFSELQVIK